MKRFAGLIITAGLGVILLVVYLAKDRTPEKSATDSAKDRARARFAACMIGQPPGGENLELRLRGISIAAAEDATWPKRCGAFAEELDRFDKRTRVAPLLESVNREDWVKYEVLSPLREASTTKLDFAAATRGVPRPPEPNLPPDPPLLHNGHFDAAAGWPGLSVLIRDGVACRFQPKDNGLEPLAHCSFRGDATTVAMKGRPQLVRGTDGTELLAHDYKMIAPWNGGPVQIAKSLTISPSRVGDTLYGIAETKRTTLLVQEGGKLRTTPLDRPVMSEGELVLLGDHLVFEDKGHVLVRAVGGAAPGPITDLGFAAPKGSLREACTTASTVAADLVVENGQRFLALRIAGTWKLVGPINGIDRRVRYHCLEDRVVLMDVDEESKDGKVNITRVDCRVDGCKNEQVTLDLAASVVEAVPQGDEVLLVWAGDAIWARHAKLSALQAAPRVVLYNGFGFGVAGNYVSSSSLVQGIDAVVRGASTIVFLYSSGTLAVHLRDGKVEPVRVVYD